MKQILLLSILLICFSCKKEIKAAEEQTIDSIAIEQSEIKQQDFYAFLKEYQFAEVPLKDSTNFDNYRSVKKLSNEELQLLGIDKITKSKSLTRIRNASIQYRLNLSDNFNSLVMSFQNGEHELFTVLVNYGRDYSVIDWEYIAYDEIAESMLRTESEISREQLVVTETNYANEVPEVEKTIFKIGEYGKFESKE